MENLYDVIIIGSGPAGLSAAIYAKRAKLSSLTIEANFASGGQVLNTYEVDNYPGLNEADRTAEGFARMFGNYFPPEFSITEGNAWMSTLNNSVQYVSVIRPGEKVAKLVKRMHYVSFVGMFRSDLFEGLCVGHAPKKCKICGKWFLTTNARHTKYCGGYAPGDKLHRTCRQIGNLKGREQRELADDHPVKQIYEKRLNTINRYVKRGTLDADLAEVMKKLAKDKMLRALSNVAYAKGAYEKEMDQAALKKEASAKIYKERDKHE